MADDQPTREELDAAMNRLCRKETLGKTWPFLKTCIRPKDHKGRCKGIENGMTEAEALRISEVS